MIPLYLGNTLWCMNACMFWYIHTFERNKKQKLFCAFICIKIYKNAFCCFKFIYFHFPVEPFDAYPNYFWQDTRNNRKLINICIRYKCYCLYIYLFTLHIYIHIGTFVCVCVCVCIKVILKNKQNICLDIW